MNSPTVNHVADERLRHLIRTQRVDIVVSKLPLHKIVEAIANGTNLQIEYLDCPQWSSLQVDWDENLGKLEVHATYIAVTREFYDVRNLVVLPGTGGTFDFTATLGESRRSERPVFFTFHVDLQERAMYARLP